MTPASPATVLLQRLDAGDDAAASELFDIVYGELRNLARAWTAGSARTPTLPPTALVNEAYLRLVQVEGLRAESRAHFFRQAAKAMRSVLVDHARERAAAKRGSGAAEARVSSVDPGAHDPALEILEIDELLGQLAGADATSAQIVEMRLFGGLANDDIATALQISTRTVERSLRAARAWMNSKLGRAMDARGSGERRENRS